MKDKIMNLLTVKSIVTIILTVVFAKLSVEGKITAEQFLTLFTIVIGFYFGTQHEKKSNEIKSDELKSDELKFSELNAYLEKE